LEEVCCGVDSGMLVIYAVYRKIMMIGFGRVCCTLNSELLIAALSLCSKCLPFAFTRACVSMERPYEQVIDAAVGRWCTHLRACVKAKGRHFNQ